MSPLIILKKNISATFLQCLIVLVLLNLAIVAQAGQQKTFCNPLNLDYGYTPIPEFAAQGKHRATADPVIALFKGNYYLFSTNQWGYWWSEDMLNWHFISRKFLKPGTKSYDELCAPAVWVVDDALFVIGSTYSKDFAIWKSSDPRTDNWTVAVENFQVGAWDPAFFLDDDGRLYLYHGSSNLNPVYGIEINRKTLQPIGSSTPLICLHDDIHGWERFGEGCDNTFLRPFIEGSWMSKHNGKYYLQYAAPGTEFSGYGDGVYVGEHPFGPFVYQVHNPFSSKPGGFACGAGHGATFQDKSGDWWHVSTIALGVKNNFERRIGIWPADFDKDGILKVDTAYGDYPCYLPGTKKEHFSGWMLLNYKKPVRVSSTYGSFNANNAVDENLKTYWSAATGDKDEWLESDLGNVCEIHAVQINYADQDAEFLGKSLGVSHRYQIYSSQDGFQWKLMIDKSANKTDVPHDYVELESPVQARFVKIVNVGMPTGKFALCGFRVFGFGKGEKPTAVKNFCALRGASENRNAWLKWQMSDNAIGYVIYVGIAPDKLYSSVMVYGANEYYFRAMDRGRKYYFQIEAFNENGISEKTSPLAVEPQLEPLEQALSTGWVGVLKLISQLMQKLPIMLGT
ncbi:MAG: family 43 glycosylhydrolase [Candidatus Riflebacteria bacterium]|nr:family 43 glycosylhydrolase [Candidatus Riflebacteria bacterium]